MVRTPAAVKRLRLIVMVELGVLGVTIAAALFNIALATWAGASVTSLVGAGHVDAVASAVTRVDLEMLAYAAVAGGVFAGLLVALLRVLQGRGGIRRLLAGQVLFLAAAVALSIALWSGDGSAWLLSAFFVAAPLAGLALLLSPAVRGHASRAA